MNRLSRTIVKPTPKYRKFDPSEGPVVDGASRFETPMNLEEYGYVEEEYLISGEANTYAWPNLHLAPVITNSGCPYCSRIIVRKPKDPAKFSGIVAFESFNGSFTIDHCNAGWGLTCEEILASGDAWVGYTKDGNCLASLREINPVKYGEVGLPNPLPEEERGDQGWDPMFEYFQKHGLEFVMKFDSAYERSLVFDMVFQMVALLKSGLPGSPFAGFDVRKVIGIGINDYNSYIAGFQDLMVLENGDPVIDGYLMYMSGGGGWIAYNHDMFDFTDPRCSRRCGVPVIRVETAGDMRDVPPHPFWAALWRCEDSDEPGNASRWYEIPGLGVGAAFRQDISCFAGEEDYAALGMTRRGRDEKRLYWNQMCLHIYQAAFHNLKDWITEAKLPPKQEEYLQLTGMYPNVSFALDEYGNHIGGIRHPYVEVPAASWDDASNCEMFDRETRDALYSDHQDYVNKVRAYAEKMVEERWILPRAVEMLVRQAEELPWD